MGRRSRRFKSSHPDHSPRSPAPCRRAGRPCRRPRSASPPRRSDPPPAGCGRAGAARSPRPSCTGARPAPGSATEPERVRRSSIGRPPSTSHEPSSRCWMPDGTGVPMAADLADDRAQEIRVGHEPLDLAVFVHDQRELAALGAERLDQRRGGGRLRHAQRIAHARRHVERPARERIGQQVGDLDDAEHVVGAAAADHEPRVRRRGDLLADHGRVVIAGPPRRTAAAAS